MLLVGLLFGWPTLWAVGAPEFTLRFGGSDPGRGLLDQTTRKFVELSEQKSNGRIKWNYFCCDQLGGDIAQIEQMMANSIQAYGDVLEWYANWVKDFAIFGWGFTFRDDDHFARFLESPTFKEMAEKLRVQNGLRILAAAPTEPRMLWTKKPISKLDDLKGMKMRVPEIKAYLMVWEALGTKPTRVTWAEVYLALKTGVVEGAEGPVSAIYGVKFHEATPNGYLTNHILSSVHITMNEKTYQSLPPDLKKVVEESAREAVAWVRDEAQKVVKETLKKMAAEGAKIGTIDTRPFQERLREAVGKAEAEGLWSRGLWQKVQAIR
ncbi:MAG: TRAP transporter substrate-binding protein [candidate division NC10 bacterium]|nr:TRAP transporter substrate-binding protein [candidate division NC10 bacterium]